jgi:hypothetical protein
MEYKRSEMEALAQENGAKVGWNKDLNNVLVIADPSSTSTKAQAARKKGYALWSPEDFLKKTR